MSAITDLTEILKNETEYNNNPKLIKMLLEFIGQEGHKKIHENLNKELLNKYVTLSKALNRKIEEVTILSETDQLTEIYNRLKLRTVLEKEVQKVNRYELKLSIIMFDIDKFKRVNDTFGHDIGDDVLVNLCNLVKNTIREIDFFARWGGEEFIVLLPSTDINSTERLAERLREKIEKNNFKRVGQVTCSFGVTEFIKKESIEYFLKRVDDALYKAKKSGRNRVEKL